MPRGTIAKSTSSNLHSFANITDHALYRKPNAAIVKLASDSNFRIISFQWLNELFQSVADFQQIGKIVSSLPARRAMDSITASAAMRMDGRVTGSQADAKYRLTVGFRTSGPDLPGRGAIVRLFPNSSSDEFPSRQKRDAHRSVGARRRVLVIELGLR